jgi:hypothetical protein
VSGVTLDMGGSVRGRDGVDTKKVGSLTPNARGEAFETVTVGFLGVTVNASADDLEEEYIGDFDGKGSVTKVGRGWCTSEVGVRGVIGGRGETELDCDCDPGRGSVVTRVGRVPGVLTVRGRELSRSEDLLSGRGMTCSTCCMYRLSAVEGAFVRS